MKRVVCCCVVFFATFLLTQPVAADIEYERGFFGRTVVKGATLHGANGFYFDSYDQLHMANLVSHEIHTLDPETGELLATIDMDDGVVTPDDVTVGPDDAVYWTALLTGQIGRQNPDGSIEIIAQFPPGPNGITFSEEGMLYVGNYINGEVYEIDPTGQIPPRTIAVTYPTLEGMDFGPDGKLYIPTLAFGIILQVIVNGEAQQAPIPVAFDLVQPEGLAVDRRGRLVVVETGAQRLVRIDPATGEKQLIASNLPVGIPPAPNMPPQGILNGVTIDLFGAIYVSCDVENQILKIWPLHKRN